jgi:hypothetical protein
MEADVVPVAGQGAVLDAAAIQRKAHMRAAIVEREDTIFVVVGAGFKSESRPASIRKRRSGRTINSRRSRTQNRVSLLGVGRFRRAPDLHQFGLR